MLTPKQINEIKEHLEKAQNLAKELFQKKRRSLASPTAPAKGLSLIKVIYPE